MRIALVAPPWLPVPPPAYGGTESVIDVLARGLDALGHAVTLFATKDSTCPVHREWCYEQGTGLSLDAAGREVRHLAHAWDRVHAARGDEAFDVVHDHTMLGVLLASRAGPPPVPLVTTNHGRFTEEMRCLYGMADPRVRIVAISAHQASTAGDLAVARVIHHGIDVDAVPLGAGGDHAVFLGRLTPDKGVERAIRVARRAGIPLRIAAKMREPAEIAYFEQRVRPLLGRDVEYVGEIGSAEKWAFLGGARCLINPIAWDEPFGLVMIEALACGTPVIAPPVASVPEIVRPGVTGWIASFDGGLASGVIAAAQLDRAACRADAAQRFSATRMAREHVELYESVIRAGRGCSRAAAR